MNEEAIVFGLAYASALQVPLRIDARVVASNAVADWRAFHERDVAEERARMQLSSGLRDFAWALDSAFGNAPHTDDDIPF